ncbi:Schizosaccharomyces specific protein [Schizosaccharomyces osmophilus]|uniref:Schizosaccharomyces specific protein n=1 Tax=Schizosaccharomyces osmophilus TaxID=2545709 RepID=A0AAF0AWD7_9SCHI|nr:Schizosaccharomyces specific protein [Schizosaccharomyces osmophilus]WBW74551.1 Schizosaccharomyces specific protein [Schizosaccharomyces osmophilus]
MDHSRDRLHILGTVSDTFDNVEDLRSVLKYRAYFTTTDTFFCKQIWAFFTGIKSFPTENKLPLETHFNHIEWDLAESFLVQEGTLYTFDIIAPLPRYTPRTIFTPDGAIHYELTINILTDETCRIPRVTTVPVIIPFTLDPDRMPGAHHIRFGLPLNQDSFTKLLLSPKKHKEIRVLFNYPQQNYKGPGCVCPLLIDLELVQSEEGNAHSNYPEKLNNIWGVRTPTSHSSKSLHESSDSIPDRLSRLSLELGEHKSSHAKSRASSPTSACAYERYFIHVCLVQKVTFLLFNGPFRVSTTVLYEDGRWTPPTVPGLHSRVEFMVPFEDTIHGSVTGNPHLLVKHKFYVSVHSSEPSSAPLKSSFSSTSSLRKKSYSLFSSFRSSSSLASNWHTEPEDNNRPQSSSELSVKCLSQYSPRNSQKLHHKLKKFDFKLPVFIFHRNLNSELSHLPPYSPSHDPYFYLEDDEEVMSSSISLNQLAGMSHNRSSSKTR